VVFQVPVNYRPDQGLPSFECTDFWSFFDLKAFVPFVKNVLRIQKPVSDDKFLFHLDGTDVAKFVRQFILPKVGSYYEQAPGERYLVPNYKHLVNFARFVLERMLGQNLKEFLGPQVIVPQPCK
jgi:hypothetical protein